MSVKYFRASWGIWVALASLCSVLTFSSFAHAELQERIVHIPVNSAIEGQDIVLEAQVEGSFARVIYVRIYFKNPEEESFRYVEMRQEVDNWAGHIPARAISGPTINYFIAALLDNQTILTYPEFNPYNDPEEISISPRPVETTIPTPAMEIPGQQPTEPLQSLQQAEEAALPEFEAEPTDLLLLSPEEGEKIAVEDLVIAVSLMGSEREIDSSSVAIFLDGREVTSHAEISSFLGTLTLKKLSLGRHWIKVTANDTNGNQVPALISHFFILGEEDKDRPYSDVRGRVFADLRQEKFSGKSQSINFAGADFNGEYGALRYGGRAYFSSLESKDRQPINRYSFHLQTKWIGLRVGDTNPRFNDLILWGKRVRGLESYVHLGFLNVDFIYGETYRGVKGATTITVDTLTAKTDTTISRYGTFRQTLFGIRPSIGSGRHFQFGLSLVKVKDDTSSIRYGSSPKDNIVIGPDLIIRLDRGRFELRASAAISALTNNIYPGPFTKEKIEEDLNVELPFDPADYEKYLILNDSTVPLDPSQMNSGAYNVSIRLNYFHNFLRVGYKSIGSEYHSLANSYIRTDIQGFYFSDRVRLLKNRLYFNIRFEDFTDNFSQLDNNPTTDLRTLNYGLSFYPGSNLPNLNISLRNRYRNNGIDTLLVREATLDTVDRREKTLNRDFSVQLSQNFNVLEAMHSLSLNYVNSDRVDRHNDTRIMGSYSREVSTDVKMASLRSTWQIPLVTTIQYASNANAALGGLSDFKYDMFGLSGEYMLFSQKFRTFAEAQFTSASGKSLGNAVIDYSKNIYRFGLNYRFSLMHSVSFDGYIIAFNDRGETAGVANESYTDTIFRLRYEKRF